MEGEPDYKWKYKVFGRSGGGGQRKWIRVGEEAEDISCWKVDVDAIHSLTHSLLFFFLITHN